MGYPPWQETYDIVCHQQGDISRASSCARLVPVALHMVTPGSTPCESVNHHVISCQSLIRWQCSLFWPIPFCTSLFSVAGNKKQFHKRKRNRHSFYSYNLGFCVPKNQLSLIIVVSEASMLRICQDKIVMSSCVRVTKQPKVS